MRSSITDHECGHKERDACRDATKQSSVQRGCTDGSEICDPIFRITPEDVRNCRIDREATGQNIKESIRRAHLSVAGTACRIGLAGTQSVYKWLEGKNLPSMDSLFLLSQMLEKDIDEILVGTRSIEELPYTEEVICGKDNEDARLS